MAKTAIRIPMPTSMRAKQFMMFDALKGLTDAIAAKERQVCPKKEQTESRIEEINLKLCALQVGDSVTVRYYCHYGKQYRQVSGEITKIDLYWKEIHIGDITISFSEIDEITTSQ